MNKGTTINRRQTVEENAREILVAWLTGPAVKPSFSSGSEIGNYLGDAYRALLEKIASSTVDGETYSTMATRTKELDR